MTEFRNIRTDYEEFWLRSQSCWHSYFRNAQIALQAYAGRSWTDEETRLLNLENRIAQEFNIIRPQIQFFSGYMRDNMKSTIIGPVENSDQETADQLTEVMKYVYEKGQGNSILLNGFDDCLKTGISLVGMYLDYNDDPINGDIKFYKRSFNSFIIDPDFERLDLSDASEVLLRDFVTREDAKSLLPFVDPKEIDQIPAFTQDNKFKFMKNNQKFFKSKDLLSYDSYYRKKTIKVKEIVDSDSGAVLPFNGDREEEQFVKEKIEFARQLGINAELVERNKQVVELNILLTGEVVYSGPDPLGLDDYPFVPVVCHFEPQLNNFDLKIQGVALGLVDVQRAFNKRMIRKEDVMDSVVNTGYIYKVGEVDVDDIRQSGSGKMIPVNSQLPFGEVIQPIQQGSIPPGWQEETVFLQDLTQKISGVNESLMGSDEGGNTQVSGRLAQVRAANGVRANRNIFDNFEKAQQLLGSKVLRAIQKNYTPQKIERILNKQPTQQFFSGEFDRYDAVIKQSIVSQSQKDAFYFELLKLVEIFGPERIPASLLIDNLPMAGVEEVQKAIAEQEQQAQQAQIEAQEDKKRSNMLTDSVTLQNIALAEERRAKIHSDLALSAERISESEQNRAQAALDRAKTITEIASMEDERLLKVLNFVQLLQNQEIQDRQNVTEQVDSRANSVAEQTGTEEIREEIQQPEQAQNAQLEIQQLLGGQDGNI